MLLKLELDTLKTHNDIYVVYNDKNGEVYTFDYWSDFVRLITKSFGFPIKDCFSKDSIIDFFSDNDYAWNYDFDNWDEFEKEIEKHYKEV